MTDTEMGQPLIEAGVAARIPVGRFGTGEEIAQAVMLLICDAYITGQTLAVNGGASFRDSVMEDDFCDLRSARRFIERLRCDVQRMRGAV